MAPRIGRAFVRLLVERADIFEGQVFFEISVHVVQSEEMEFKMQNNRLDTKAILFETAYLRGNEQRTTQQEEYAS